MNNERKKLISFKIIFIVFSKMQFTYIAIVEFISIRKCACSQTPIVINADGNEQEAKQAIHPVENQHERWWTKSEVEKKSESKKYV